MSTTSVPGAVSQLCSGGWEGRLQRVRVAGGDANLDGAAPRVDLLLYANLDKRETSVRVLSQFLISTLCHTPVYSMSWKLVTGPISRS